MPVKSFKFVSPGVFINEIDNSFTPRLADTIGPVVVGRATRGPAMVPTKVQSYSDFVTMFGDTVPGNGGGDIYRSGNFQSPMYGTYAAKAHLVSNVSPLTYVRLLGFQSETAEANGFAGWQTTKVTPTQGLSCGGAFGVWLAPSASNGELTGSNAARLAAIVYVNSGSVSVSGSLYGDPTTNVDNTSTFVSENTQGNFVLVISGSSEKKFEVNFDPQSPNYIRKKLNTNPQLTDSSFYPASSVVDYWLGETFDQFIKTEGVADASDLVALVAPVVSGSSEGPHSMRLGSIESRTGWFVGQHTGDASSYDPSALQKLFKLVGVGHGEWLHKNVKISIERIKQSTSDTSDYGTFSVVLRSVSDLDSSMSVLERFDSLSLNPNSPKFIAKVIGDQFTVWDETTRSLKSYGEYPNQSKFVRVEMNTDVEAGATDPVLLPFGYWGPPKWSDLLDVTAASDPSDYFLAFSSSAAPLPKQHSSADHQIYSDFGAALTASFKFPTDYLRESSADGGLGDPTNSSFGYSNVRSAAVYRNDLSATDHHRLLFNSTDLLDSSDISVPGVEASYVFSLHEVSASGGDYVYSSGSMVAGTSVTSASFSDLLDLGFDSFTAPLWGGFDGLDIQKPDPFYNAGLVGKTEKTSYAYYTLKRAIDTVADPEAINMSLLSVPGLTAEGLTTHMVRVCENRADAMALIDLPNVYLPSHEAYYPTKQERIGTTPRAAANNLKQRVIDSSYGATFYPWVQTVDDATAQTVWIPPTVAVMGVLASSEKRSELWFAPAGFNRGGLSDGAANIPVVAVSERLSSKDRDLLYEARINPIASFPSSGIVLFGQKTLQERPSSLDRINVRRLVIFLKKQISILSTQVLFEQNVQSTWNRFKSLIEPFLANVKVRFGITDYKLILDESTTTPDLVDQNVMYAKIMVKPAKAIEFIAIDFVIASSGASFED